jgi:2-hydroxy-3-oxopropionate reductase
MKDFIDGARIAFLGTGHMGFHMANAIAMSGRNVVGWSRQAKSFETQPVFRPETDLFRVIDGADAVILCLRDHIAVQEVLFSSGVADRLPPGTLVVDMGTSGPDLARRHAGLLAERQVSYLDAPVSGGTAGAKSANLSIFVGGTVGDYEIGANLLRTMGRPFHLGAAGAGQAAKLANQVIVGVTIAAVAEGLAYAQSHGLDPSLFLEALHGGFASSRILELHGPRMAMRDYSAAGAVRLHLKDMILASGSGGLDALPHAALVKAGFERLAAAGDEALDHSSYAKLYQNEGMS